MYIFINKGLGMSAGKVGAQAAHAAVEAYRVSCGLVPHISQEDQTPKESHAARNWYKGGHYAKYVMEAKDSTQLFTIREYIEARGFRTALIVDEGHTECTEFVPTALGVEVVDKNNSHAAATFGEFKLYKDEPQVFVLEATDKISRADMDTVRSFVGQGDVEGAARYVKSLQRPKRRKTAFGRIF